jgi:hypothetical protein
VRPGACDQHRAGAAFDDELLELTALALEAARVARRSARRTSRQSIGIGAGLTPMRRLDHRWS